METNQKTEGEIIGEVETALQELREDVSFSLSINANIASDIEAFLSRMEMKYSESIKNIALGNKGNSELNDILGGIYETRLQFYKRLCYTFLADLREDISNMLWLKNRFSFSDKIDTIDKELMETSQTLGESGVAIKSFKDNIINISNLKNKLDIERKEIRSKLFFTTIIWGIPILLGVYISDKYAQYTTHGLLLLLMISYLSYTISGSASFQKFIIKNKMFLTGIFLFGLLAAIVLYLIIISGLQFTEKFYQDLEKNGLITIIIIVALFPFLKSYSQELKRYLKKKMLDIKIDITDKQFKPGDEIPLNLILKNTGSKIITNISITLTASGFLLDSDVSKKIRVLGMGDTQEVSYIIDVPPDSPKGDYIIQLNTEFYIETEHFMKENELTISVIK